MITIILTYTGLLTISILLTFFIDEPLRNKLDLGSKGASFIVIIALTLSIWINLIFTYNKVTEPQENYDYKIQLNKDHTIEVTDQNKAYLLDSLKQLEEFIIQDNI